MKVLITGGAGFIGGHLAERLLAEGHTVYVLDDLSTGSLNNIRHLRKHKKFIFKRGSVLNEKDLFPLASKVDFIYHLAAAVGVQYIMEKPLYSLINNIDGTKNVLKIAEKKKTPVLITSTSEVYGKLDRFPFREDADRMYGSAYNERWGYALSKAVDEFVALAYWREKKLPVIVVRLFNTVGPRQTSRYGMVIPRFVEHAKTNKPIPVYDTGKQIRCFTHVHDVVGALMQLMKTKAAYGEIVNLGSNKPITINELAKKIIKMTGSSSTIQYIPYSKAFSETFEDMQKRVPDLTKAHKLIGYKPAYSLEEILQSLING